MNVADLNTAFEQAEQVVSNANRLAGRAIRYSAGRLRTLSLDPDTLRTLKRELDGFNAKRGRWSSR